MNSRLGRKATLIAAGGSATDHADAGGMESALKLQEHDALVSGLLNPSAYAHPVQRVERLKRDPDLRRKLVEEAGALFGSRHYGSYRFLVAMTEQFGHNAIEHHESSDNRVSERAFLDEVQRKLDAASDACLCRLRFADILGKAEKYFC